MTELEDRMNELLYRVSCPSSTELGEYQLDMLPKPQASNIRRHLKECPHCTAELNQLKSFLEEVEPDLEYSLSERIKIWVAERMTDMAAPGQSAPAFAIRGQEQAPRVYRAHQAEITLEFEPDAGQKERGSLLGLLSGMDPAGLRVSLWQDGRRVDSTDIDELGNFVFTAVQTGKYQLIFSGLDVEIHIQDVEI